MAVPLSTQLSRVWVALVIETDQAVEAAAMRQPVGNLFPISYAMWANGLRSLDEDGVTVRELRIRTHARVNLGGLERWRWLQVGQHRTAEPRDRRDGYGSHRGINDDTLVYPTRAGRWARRVWPACVADVESRWRSRFGPEVIAGLRASLISSNAASSLSNDRGSSGLHPSALPWSLPEVAATDGFRSRAISDPLAATEDPDALPLIALLAQALTALTLGYERDSTVSLPLAADVLRPIGSEVVSIRDLRAAAGISKEAVAMAITYLRGQDLGSMLPDRRFRLCDAGLSALQDYRDHDNFDDPALGSALEPVLSDPVRLAEGMRPPDGGWRAEPSYRIATRRLLDDPLGQLPWQPMVLHRGGWPDGS